jgi:7-cyano-7-deazaguanine synthase
MLSPPDPQLSSLPLALLISGGLDSAILLCESLGRHPVVQPIYIRSGLAWEEAELSCLERLLAAATTPSLQRLVVLDQPVADIYGEHWSVTGQGVPGADTPDAAVYLPGRNVLLLTKAFLWCHLHHFSLLAIAPLENNPFPDSTIDFFDSLEKALNQAVDGHVRFLQPYRRLHKADVLRRGSSFPLKHSFSCIRPIWIDGAPLHCGTCNKCAERQKGFADAGLADPTIYHQETKSCSL